MLQRVLPMIVLCSTLAPSIAQDLGTPAQLEEGERLYRKFCSQCHGDNGDGRGVAAAHQKPRPRDFTTGKYKIRSTATGSLPTTDDLKRIIRVGMPYTAMPGWPEFNDRQLTALAYYLKTFYPGFEGAEGQVTPLQFPRPPRITDESLERGRHVYEQLGCAQCHGDLGRGDGPSAPTLADDSGYHIRAANLTHPWTFRGGASRADIYRTLMTGFNGTPMPSFEDEGALPAEDRWPLVDFIASLSNGERPEYANLVLAVYTDQEIDSEAGVELFESAPPARFPVIGQIMEPGRNFYPPMTSVDVRAVYDFDSIAFLVEWDDMAADTSGRNSPLLEVPPFDPRLAEEMEQVRTSPQDAADDAFDDIWDTTAAIPIPRATEFSDAVAIQLPKSLPTGFSRPYFIMGDTQNPVELWFVDLGDSRPQLLTAQGSGSIVNGDGEPFAVSAHFREGRWSVLFKRKRTSIRSVSFQEGQFVPIAFSVWDGFNHDRGNKRGLTSWYTVYVQPREQPSPIGPILTNSLAVLAVLVIVVFLVRRKYASELNESTPIPQEVKE